MNFLSINCAQYRFHVIVTWETTIKEIVDHVKTHGIDLDSDWQQQFEEIIEKATGAAMHLGFDNTDILVWLRNKPGRIDDGAIYHELFHAVQFIQKDKNMREELESPAYLFEYLVLECHKRFKIGATQHASKK